MRRTLVVLTVWLIGAGCTGDDGSVLAENHRIPDEEGEVTAISFERIELDGGRAFDIHPQVESFTTRGHQPTPLLRLEGKYVHVGVNNAGEAIWIAGIGVVVRGEPRRVLYTGVFEGTDDEGRLLFQDGTVLRAADGLELPEEGREALAVIDPDRQVVVEIRRQ